MARQECIDELRFGVVGLYYDKLRDTLALDSFPTLACSMFFGMGVVSTLAQCPVQEFIAHHIQKAYCPTVRKRVNCNALISVPYRFLETESQPLESMIRARLL